MLHAAQAFPIALRLTTQLRKQAVNQPFRLPADTNSRRNLLLGSAGIAATFGIGHPANAADSGSSKSATAGRDKTQRNSSNFLGLKDGASLYYKDWGDGRPVVFSHGWPLTADAWDAQMVFLAERGFRVVAHDRRGHGRSSQPWDGNNMDTYADDLAALMDHLDLKNTVMVGHSTGGGEVVRYIGRHGTKRVAKAVLVGAVPPWMARAPGNPNGAPMEVFDQLRAGVRADHSQFYKDLSGPFFGANLPNAKPWAGLRDSFWVQGMMGSHKSLLDCIKAFSETDFTEDLKKVDIPTLLIHGEADQIAPMQLTSERSVKLLKDGKLKVYAGAPHGLPMTHQDMFNEDILAFAKP
jgi:non-heme chloroperoxidase